MSYPSLRIEGNIISPDILTQLENEELNMGQRAADFGLPAGSKVKDEIAYSWAEAQEAYRRFKQRSERLQAKDAATSATRQAYMVPFFSFLGYDLQQHTSGLTVTGQSQTYPISHTASNRGHTPIYIIGYNDPAGLDRKPENATRRMSAHALIQEYLNLSESLYGIVTNGHVIRLLRDSSRLVKQSFLEFDLDRIFEDNLYADFALLYRILHATRLPAQSDRSAECLLEIYHLASLDAGSRIREKLSGAVEQAIRTFANGFLTHPANEPLRHALRDQTLTADVFYQQQLRLIYRLLFLMVIEERNLIFADDVSPQLREIYRQGYSVQRLRQRAERLQAHDKRHHDLWHGLRSTFHLFEVGGLGIQPLAGDLFGAAAIADLHQCYLNNDVLLQCIGELSMYKNDKGLISRVNYAALNVEEFGSVYEGLLEFKPVITNVHDQPRFDFAHGDERAATGSHYTPDDLVQPLIKHSLDHLIADCLKQPDAAAALLNLRVADIACGSGHILLAAARRIATKLATVRTREEQPSPSAYRGALRDTIRACIYGVDVNPLAVELCKVALWIEAHEPGKPLNFLDHHIKCGNAIVGFVRIDDVAHGVADEAFTATPHDNKDIAGTLRKANREARKSRGTQVMQLGTRTYDAVTAYRQQLDKVVQMPERTVAEVQAKSHAYNVLTNSQAMRDIRTLADIPVAQFFIPKDREHQARLITDHEFQRLWQGTASDSPASIALVHQVAAQKRFFHWFLEFPDIVARGGFDCILGNPPYLGGQALSGTYGHAFCTYVKCAYAPAGLSDLVVYFVRRIYSLLPPKRFTAFITTNSIKDGDVRKDGLEQVVAQGGSIQFAIRGMKWPGLAKLVVSLIGLYNGKWQLPYTLDGTAVPNINAYLESNNHTAEPESITENANRIFQGSIFRGDGFLLSHNSARELIALNPKTKEVIREIINGSELNNHPTQSPQRSTIDFYNLPEHIARQYPEAFEIVETLVRPVRMELDSSTSINKDNQNRWWQYAAIRESLYEHARKLSLCFVSARTTKYLNFSACPSNIVFSDALNVFTTDRWDLYSVVQSTIHEVWARKYSGALETRLRYSPSDCFETFAFPAGIWQEARPELAAIGAQYHEHRRMLMHRLWLGLTDVYNLFHARDLAANLERHYAVRTRKDPRGEQIPAEYREAARTYDSAQAQRDIEQLRTLHRALDHAVLAAYSWHDVDSAHDFYEVDTLPENDRVRYTIAPDARRELLTRLLAENHARASAETALTPTTAPRKATGKKQQLDDDEAAQRTLF
jgi:hypothetical protein